MKKHITTIIPAIILLCGCTPSEPVQPSEAEIQVACINLKEIKANRLSHERMFTNCVSGSKRTITEDDNVADAVSHCRIAAADAYPVETSYFPRLSPEAYTEARARNCGQ